MNEALSEENCLNPTEASGEFFLRSEVNETSGIFSEALTFLVLFASRQKEKSS